MARSPFLAAGLALVGACGTLKGNPEAPTDGGTDAAVSTSTADAGDALAPTCGWTPFDDGFEG